jgi:hypothetical protein
MGNRFDNLSIKQDEKMDIILNKDIGTSKTGETVKAQSVVYGDPSLKKEVQSVMFKGEVLYPSDFKEIIK